MTIGTVLCWGGWLWVLFFVNPYEADRWGLLFFYSSLFLALVGTISIIGFVVRFLIIKHEFAYKQVKRALRQGIMLAALVVVSLYLQSQNLLVWWNLILLVLLVMGIEYFFIATED